MDQITVTPTEKPDNLTEESTPDKQKQKDYNSMFTLGLGIGSAFINKGQDQRNRRMLNQSIQQRQTKPVYDYNYMYGRTTTGGSQYQPIIKAEMGAQITNRYNTEGNALNNVEIEGGEYIQLPNMQTEIAMGPSHSNGGINTSLPEGTRVYSDTLKPQGSKKTLAQMAKKYDNTKYDEVLNNKFAKQVDRDTAMIMKQKNQKILDKLFMDQQLLNGNSNGEVMAKKGASIDNPGFRALPPAVQQKIISNMEYGGFSLPNPLYMQEGGDTPLNPGMLISPEQAQRLGDTPEMGSYQEPAPQQKKSSQNLGPSTYNPERYPSQPSTPQQTQSQAPNYSGDYWLNPQMRNSPMVPYNPMAGSVSTQKGQGQGFMTPEDFQSMLGGQPMYTGDDFINPLSAGTYDPMAGNVGGANAGTQGTTQATTPQAPKSGGSRKGATSTAGTAGATGTSTPENNLPEHLKQYAKWDKNRGKFRVELPSGLSAEDLTTLASEAESYGISNIVQSGSARLKGPASEYTGFYAGLTPQDYEKKIVLEEMGADASK